ncbi:hypothetical protein KSC_082950 [Ktedonobacter sp. SOSP1-52]|nr:hypothetical protein KSC_082950 [Ktedonobacter sp. SOSP1-52]
MFQDVLLLLFLDIEQAEFGAYLGEVMRARDDYKQEAIGSEDAGVFGALRGAKILSIT